METYIQTGLGILVSVLLFLVGYRQTIGARRERIKSANEKLIETILRRLILEKYSPKKDDIQRLIEGKARDYKVKHKDLLSVDQVLNTIYTRIFENDLISQEQRENNVERLSALFEIDKAQDIEQIFDKTKDRSWKLINWLVIVLGVLSSIIGVSVVSFDKLVNFETELNSNILLTIIGSILATFTVYIFLKFKDSQESSEETDLPRNPYRDYVKFEKEVVHKLRKQNIQIRIPKEKDNGFDLIAEINGKDVAIEIKNWKNRPPISFLRQIISRMDFSMKKQGIKQGIIVTNNSFSLSNKLRLEQDIKILNINEFTTLIRKK